MEANTKSKKAWYKKWWVWVIALFVVIGIAGASGDKEKSATKSSSEPATSQASEPSAEEPKWDAAAIYAQINAGMTKTEAEKIIAKTSDNCVESSIEGYGSSETCTYTGGGFTDTGSITITYSNGTVQSKLKAGF